MSIIGAILAFVFLDGALRIAAIGVLLLTDVAEIALWLKWRKRRAATGAEGIVGSIGTTITRCDPAGQVKVKGQIWSARASEEVLPGTQVVVTGSEGIELKVSPREQARDGRPAGRLL